MGSFVKGVVCSVKIRGKFLSATLSIFHSYFSLGASCAHQHRCRDWNHCTK